MSGPRKHPWGCTCRTHVDRPWHRPEHWSTAEVNYLETWYGRRPDEAIARVLGRSVLGLHLKARRLGLRKRAAGMTGREVAEIFGVDSGTVGKVWVHRGLMRSVRTFRQGPYLCHIIDPADVERFIREHPEYVDVAKMPPSWYRDLAARDPWIGLPEVHRQTGRPRHAIATLIREGSVEGRRRGRHWYMPVRELPKIRHLAPEAIAESVFRHETILQVRRDRRKGIWPPRPTNPAPDGSGPRRPTPPRDLSAAPGVRPPLPPAAAAGEGAA